ncbi:MAG: NAD(P)/FAD-dependent oxidoreductase [Candidatus Aenigmatarchaeota archaeon]
MPSNTKSYDILVVGAGPSGLNTAFGLARNGYNVLIIEARKEVGKGIVCAGVVSEEVFQKFDLTRNSIIREINYAEVRSPYGTSVSYKEEKPFAYVIDRKLFDHELQEKAISAGAEIQLDTEVKSVEIKNDGVEVFAESNGTKVFYADIIVLATGIRTDLSRKLGLGYPKRFLKAIQEEISFSTAMPLTVFVGNDISDSAFAWTIPSRDGLLRVGLMAEDDCIRRFEKFTVKNFPGTKFNNPKVKPIAQGLVEGTFRDRCIVVGESAGQVKTTTGGGIYWGLLCSEIAVDVINKAFIKGDFSAGTLSEYEKRWHELIGDEIRAGLTVRRFCSYLGDKQIERIIQLARTDGLIDFIRRNAVFDWHGRTLLNLLKMDSLREIFRF